VRAGRRRPFQVLGPAVSEWCLPHAPFSRVSAATLAPCQPSPGPRHPRVSVSSRLFCQAAERARPAVSSLSALSWTARVRPEVGLCALRPRVLLWNEVVEQVVTSVSRVGNVPTCSVSIFHLKRGRYFIVQTSSRQREPFFPPIGCAFSISAIARATFLSANSTQPSVKCAFLVAVCFFRKYARRGSVQAFYCKQLTDGRRKMFTFLLKIHSPNFAVLAHEMTDFTRTHTRWYPRNIDNPRTLLLSVELGDLCF
jgi:hypothetical protein